MGNIMLFGNLCGSCDVKGEYGPGEQKQKEKNKSNSIMEQIAIDQIVIKEISEREALYAKMEQIVDKMRRSLQGDLDEIKKFCEYKNDFLTKDFENCKESAFKSITELREKDNKQNTSLREIDRHIGVLNTKIEHIETELKEFRIAITDLTKTVISNQTKLSIDK